VVVAALVAVLGLLVLVLELAAHYRAGNSTDDTMTTQLVAAKVSGRTAAKRTHQASVALSLCVGIGSTVLLLAGLAVSIRALALGILVLRVGALLGELVLRLGAGVLTLLLAVSGVLC
jgi:hypothetical protein